MKKRIVVISAAFFLGYGVSFAFCGFYVAKAGSELYNKKSEVIMVRDGKKTVLTMSNDFEGNVKDFAMVVPVPEVLRERDIKIVENTLFESFDAYSAPRLVEYYDESPCREFRKYNLYSSSGEGISKSFIPNVYPIMEADVKIEAKYSIGEYDILILSSTESLALKKWLTQHNYHIPDNANEVLDPYIKSNLKFFVVKVNLEKQRSIGFQNLRPIQITYESDRFMLPIRLGMANSKGHQDLIVYSFTKKGRVETSNYRTVKTPTGNKIPTFVKNEFGEFYSKLFDKIYAKEDKQAVFLEYAWTVTPSFQGMKCDPCIGPPPIYGDLLSAGVDWVNDPNQQVFFTRLHVRYTREKFPQDLFFVQTADKEHFQARYVITNPADHTDCPEAKTYLSELKTRKELELREFIALTNNKPEEYNWYIGKQSPSRPESPMPTRKPRRPIQQGKKTGMLKNPYPKTSFWMGLMLVCTIGFYLSKEKA